VSGLIWVENQVSLGANESVMGKSCCEQWLWDMAYTEVKHYHGNNDIFSAEEYCLECKEKGQSQSFSGVGAQHQNARAEHAIQIIMFMAHSLWCMSPCIGQIEGRMTSCYGLLQSNMRCGSRIESRIASLALLRWNC
jgi:hypothetical protein